MQNERKSSGINIGSASIIMVFSVVCLTVFAVLSLVTANSEYNLAVKSTDVIKNYYAADAAANEKLAELKSAADSNDTAALNSKAKELDINCEDKPEGIAVNFSQKVSDSQELLVDAVYQNGEYKINEWRLSPTKDWKPDEGMQFWDGEF